MINNIFVGQILRGRFGQASAAPYWQVVLSMSMSFEDGEDARTLLEFASLFHILQYIQLVYGG